MIFLSLGTHRQPFDRALDLVLPLAGGKTSLVVQHGHTPPRPQVPDVEWHQYLPFDTMTSYIVSSEAFICHAGVGSVLTAMTMGVVPVVIPRKIPRQEHVDAHQEEFARELHERGVIVGLLERDPDVEDAIAKARALKGRHGGPRSGHLVEVIGRALREA